MSDHEPEPIDGAPPSQVSAEAVLQLGRARGLDWTLAEAAAIRDQLVSTHEALRRAEARIDPWGEEPASAFTPDRGR